jgi:hypothetical protein
MTDQPDTLGDLVIGAPAIARFIFSSDEPKYRRRVYFLCEAAKCKLPHFRLGFQLAVRKSVLQAWIKSQEKEASQS